MADLQKLTITNVSGGPKVVNAVPIVTLQPGESRDVEMIDAEVKVAKGTEWFEFKGGADADSKPSLTNKNKAQLLEIAEAEAVEIADDATNAQITEAIEAKRAEA